MMIINDGMCFCLFIQFELHRFTLLISTYSLTKSQERQDRLQNQVCTKCQSDAQDSSGENFGVLWCWRKTTATGSRRVNERVMLRMNDWLITVNEKQLQLLWHHMTLSCETSCKQCSRRSPHFCYDFKWLRQSSTVVGLKVQVLMSLEECKS